VLYIHGKKNEHDQKHVPDEDQQVCNRFPEIFQQPGIHQKNKCLKFSLKEEMLSEPIKIQLKENK
jgi:hypothetical protein